MTNPNPHQQTTGQIGDHSSGNIIGDHNTQIHIYPAPQRQLEELFDVDEVETRYCRQVITHYDRFSLLGLTEYNHRLQATSLESIFVNLNLAMIQVGEDDIGRQERIRLEQKLEKEKERGDQADRIEIDKIQNQLETLKTQAQQPRTVTLLATKALAQYKRLMITCGATGTSRFISYPSSS